MRRVIFQNIGLKSYKHKNEVGQHVENFGFSSLWSLRW